jgi:hypothetical protein
MLAQRVNPSPRSHKGVAMIVEIEPLQGAQSRLCSHPQCDGRDAKWRFPQTQDQPTGELVSCSIHIARIVEHILRWTLGVEVPINHGRRPRRNRQNAKSTDAARAA